MKISHTQMKFFLLFTLFSGATFASNATNPYQVFSHNRIDFDIRTSYFKTQANYLADGQQQALTGGNYLQNIEFTPSVRWEMVENLGLIAGFNVASSESSDALSTRKNSIINRVDIGADYLFWSSAYHDLFFRLSYSHALEKISFNTDAVSNSDGANEIKPQVVLRYHLDGIYPYAEVGLNYRSEGLSMLATYEAGLEARFTEFGVGAAFKGKASIKDDEYTNSSNIRDAVNSRVNAGSKKYFSVNPNSTDLELNLNFSASKDLLFKTFAAHSLLGSNSAVGYTIGLNVNYNFDADSGYKKSSTLPKQKVKPTENMNTISREPTPTDFKEDINDGVNQEYFKPVAPVEKSYINQVEGSSESLQNATSAEDQGEVEIQMKKKDNKDYSIKLKPLKKKKGN
jgi:hypothetical protein